MLQAHSFCACIFHSNPLYSCLGAAKDKKKKSIRVIPVLKHETFFS